MKSRARISSVRVSGSDFVKTFKSRSRIFKQGSRRLGESRILPFATPNVISYQFHVQSRLNTPLLSFLKSVIYMFGNLVPRVSHLTA